MSLSSPTYYSRRPETRTAPSTESNPLTHAALAVHHPWAVLGLEATNTIFFFSGFVALAAFLSKLLFCRGAVCGSARAATAFGAFEFCLWAATAAFTFKDALRGGFAGLRGGRRPGNTQMQFQQQAGPAASPQMKEAAMAA